MQEILIILNDPPYGTERSYNGVRRSTMDELARRTLAADRVLVF